MVKCCEDQNIKIQNLLFTFLVVCQTLFFEFILHSSIHNYGEAVKSPSLDSCEVVFFNIFSFLFLFPFCLLILLFLIFFRNLKASILFVRFDEGTVQIKILALPKLLNLYKFEIRIKKYKFLFQFLKFKYNFKCLEKK